jgi:N-acetylmuramic acid 6-phosphate etherase
LIDWVFHMDHLETEARNPASANLDELTPVELVRLMNAEDANVVPAVASQAEKIARAIEVIAQRLAGGGRLVYAGAGTSGRLGVLDATECPPTFNAPAGQVIGIIAGGPAALTAAVEGAEDHPEFAEQDLSAVGLSARDVLVGIATSGRTPYVLGAIAVARRLGAFTIGLACNADAELIGEVDLAITPVVGPEVLSGSTRLKAGTATKLVLNMLSTGAMVRLGKVFGNFMVDLRATNEKLSHRTNRIVRLLSGLDRQQAEAMLERCGRELKTAIVCCLAEVEPDEARRRLKAAGGKVRLALPQNQPAKIGNDALQPRKTGDPKETLALGIDGGGTRTVALLARGQSSPDGRSTVLGRGEAGPSNLQVVGAEKAYAALDRAVENAFSSANLPRTCVQVAWFGLAGAGRSENQELVRSWALRRGIAADVEVTADAPLLLAAGTPDGWGVAIIAGTGSMAVGRSPDSRSSRAGGWGYLFGDEGSGYALSLAAFRAVAHMADGRGPDTSLAAALLERLQLDRPQDLIAMVYGGTLDRPALAALAPLVLEAAQAGDAVASAIVQDGAEQLAAIAAACARRIALEPPVPLALAGGLLLGSASYRERVVRALAAQGIAAAPVAVVPEPAAGAVRLALMRHAETK